MPHSTRGVDFCEASGLFMRKVLILLFIVAFGAGIYYGVQYLPAYLPMIPGVHLAPGAPGGPTALAVLTA